MSRWSQGTQEIEQLLARRHLERSEEPAPMGVRGWRKRDADWAPPRRLLSTTQSRRLSSPMTPPGSSAKRSWRSRVCDPRRPAGTLQSATPCAPSSAGR